MKENNVYLSQRLATDSDKFHLSCLINKDMVTVNKQFVWLEFTEITCKDYPNQKEVWDSSDYIFFEFYNYLKHRLDNSVTKQELEDFKDMEEYLKTEDVHDLLKLLNTTKELNWN